MFDIKELIEIGLSDGKDPKKLLSIMAESIDDEDSKIEIFEHLYTDIYGHHLCNKFCMKMVEEMYNNTEKGQKWTVEQTNDLARKIGISFNNSDNDYSQYEFWCTVHMMYYDYSTSLEESGINANDISVFGKMADSYLDDIDSYPGKLVNYFFFLVNKKTAID